MRAAAIGCGLCLLLGEPGAVRARPRARRYARLATRAVAPTLAPERQLEPPRREAPEPAQLAPGLRLDAPPVAQPSSVRRWGMFAGGMTLFLAGWGAEIGLSYGLGLERPALSLIPVFGPLAQMGSRVTVVDPSATGNAQIDGMANERIAAVNNAAQTVAYVVLGIDCAMQLAGLTLAIVGALPASRRPAERAPTTPRLGLASAGAGRVSFALTF